MAEELLYYDNNDQFRDAVDDNGDVVSLDDIESSIDSLAEERAAKMQRVRARAGGHVLARVKNANDGSVKRSQPRYSTRGGRSFNEGADSELDPNWNVNRPKLSGEQCKINQAGAEVARRALAEARAKAERT